MSPLLLEPENIISFSSRGMDGSQLARAWHEHDRREMIGRGIFSGLFCKLQDDFHYYFVFPTRESIDMGVIRF